MKGRKEWGTVGQNGEAMGRRADIAWEGRRFSRSGVHQILIPFMDLPISTYILYPLYYINVDMCSYRAKLTHEQLLGLTPEQGTNDLTLVAAILIKTKTDTQCSTATISH